MADRQVRRLFLFAVYDAFSTVGDALLSTLKCLSENGDVVLCADCHLPECELDKVRPFVLHALAVSHGEYDFGSYKRCWEWASDHICVVSYDFVYMVNDSVYGPFVPLDAFLTGMENMGCQAFGPVFSTRKRGPHIQSWFIGLRAEVFTRKEFDMFLRGVSREMDKRSVCKKYETGFTTLLTRGMKVSVGALISTSGKRVYNDVLNLYREGLPFLKKAALTHHGGSIGGQVARLLKEISQDDAAIVLSDARRVLGDEYVDWLLTTNPLRLTGRYLKHVLGKIRG